MTPENEFPWATFLVSFLTLVAVISGAVVVIVGDSALSFERYLDMLWKFAIAAGLLGVGRGIRLAGRAFSKRQ
jgi:hypothetical protein